MVQSIYIFIYGMGWKAGLFDILAVMCICCERLWWSKSSMIWNKSAMFSWSLTPDPYRKLNRYMISI